MAMEPYFLARSDFSNSLDSMPQNTQLTNFISIGADRNTHCICGAIKIRAVISVHSSTRQGGVRGRCEWSQQLETAPRRSLPVMCWLCRIKDTDSRLKGKRRGS